MEEVKEETTEMTKWQKVKRFFKEKGPVILGILSVVGLTAVCEARVYNEGYSRGRKKGQEEGEWFGYAKMSGLNDTLFESRRFNRICKDIQPSEIVEAAENDEEMAKVLAEHNFNPDDVFVATKVYNFIYDSDRFDTKK